MGWACATRSAHPCVYAFGEMTSNLEAFAGGFGSSASARKLSGSYQAPKYHIKTMLRARYLVSGVACTLSIIAWARSDDFRLSLVICSKRLSVAWRLLFTQLKYSCLTSIGSDPGSDFSRSMSASDGCGRNPGANFASAMPVSAPDSNTKRIMSWRIWAFAGLSTAPTDIAAVAAAAPARTVRRVTPHSSSSRLPCAIACSTGCGKSLAIGPSDLHTRFNAFAIQRAFSRMNVKSDWLKNFALGLAEGS